jgi:Sigma-70 region 2
MSGPLALLDAGNDDPPQALPPFDDVYTSHAANVYRFCLSQLGGAEAATDVTQDAFIKAFSAYERVSPDPETTRTSDSQYVTLSPLPLLRFPVSVAPRSPSASCEGAESPWSRA